MKGVMSVFGYVRQMLAGNARHGKELDSPCYFSYLVLLSQVKKNGGSSLEYLIKMSC